jgi:hypothetical protein
MNYLIYQYWNIFYQNFKEIFEKIKIEKLDDYEVVLLTD